VAGDSKKALGTTFEKRTFVSLCSCRVGSRALGTYFAVERGLSPNTRIASALVPVPMATAANNTYVSDLSILLHVLTVLGFVLGILAFTPCFQSDSHQS
jgi:hypothetical protein